MTLLKSFERELYRSAFDSQMSLIWTRSILFSMIYSNCFWIALQTINCRPKQTETLLYGIYSVKQGQVFVKCYFYRTKRPPFSKQFFREKRHLYVPDKFRTVNSPSLRERAL